MGKELIKIEERNGQQAVNARELHEALGSKQEFANWIKNRIEKYGFVENQDFEVFDNSVKNSQGGRPTKEYALSLDMAKELAMVENNDNGRKIRQYFIECERELRMSPLPSYQIDDPIKRAEAWIREQQEKKLLQIENKAKQALIEEKDNRLDIARTIYKEERPLVNYSKGVLAEDNLVEVHALGKMLSNIKELNMGPKKIWGWLRDHKYIKPHDTEPYQKFITEKKWFVFKENQVRNIFGLGTHKESKTYLTPAGRIAIVNQMYKEKGLEAPNELELKFE